ncbi:MAG: hypothetical protein Q7J98_13830 [Kiritimatiellia bacterium]|nr:hypothetical protein [Kiritimatiellia bacterium]
MKIERTQDYVRVAGDFFRFEWRLSAAGEMTGAWLNDFETEFPLVDESAGTVPALVFEGEGWIRTLKDAVSTEFVLGKAGREKVVFGFSNVVALPGGGNLSVRLDYTVYATGVLFCRLGCAYPKDAPKVTVRRCSLGMTVPFERYEWFRWWCFKRPPLEKIEHDEAENVFTVSVGESGLDRFKTRADARHLAGCLDPYIGIDFGRSKRFSNHVEFFLEEWKAFGTRDRAMTGNDFSGKNGALECRWDLLNSPVNLKPGTRYTNTWGIAVSRTRQKSLSLGQRVYHWFDKDTQPTADLIDAMAKYGCSILCLHERSWPSHPVRCDEVKDPEATRALVERCHSRGIRVMFYSRMYEAGLKKGWFGKALKKNYDGIYVDGGTPWCMIEEDYRFPAARFYRGARLVRKLVGPKGLFISHTGPWITAVGQDLVDGYLSGEQERGHLMDDLESNLFFTSQSIGVPMIWTGAFAQYRNPRAVAFYAGTGEFPHVSLGTQLPGPLSHPRDPIFRQYIVPLWLMWKSVPMEKATLYSVNNHPPVYISSDPNVFAAVYRVNPLCLLVTIANISEKLSENAEISLDAAALGISGAFTVYEMKGKDYWDFTVRRLAATSEGNIRPGLLESYGIRGYLFVKGKPAYLARYLKEIGAKEKEPPAHYLDFVKGKNEEAGSTRHLPKGSGRVFLNVDIPDTTFGFFKGFYEIQIWNTEFAMTAKTAGYLCGRGIVKEKPSHEEEYINAKPGEFETGWLDFTPYLTPGNNVVTLISCGEMTPGSGYVPIYFAGRIRLSTDGATVAREFRFDNEIDKDSTAVSFSIDR